MMVMLPPLSHGSYTPQGDPKLFYEWRAKAMPDPVHK